ncbi:MAG: flagellar motor switch protein FliG [Ignavibacteriae bacterium]|nr:MAG: flagellar motor switch protein FliG [Ignavibacteriota bacterium]
MSIANQIDTQITSKNDLNGIQKSALLLIALDVDTASQVFKHLEPNFVEAISAEISKVKNIPSHVVEQVLDDYHELVTAREYVLEGGIDYAKQVLEKSFGITKAMEVIDKVKNLTTLHGFDVLKKADSAQLINFLNKEHPQTIALILSHLSPDQVAEAVTELPEELRTEVVYRIATLGKISPQTLQQIERVVDELAGFSINQTMGQLGGPQSVANILNRVNVSMNKEIIASIQDKDEDVGLEIKRLMFLFDDIIHLQDRDIQRILKEVDRKDLGLSLKVAEDRVQEKIFSNMSERASELLKEELQFMGPVKLKEVEAAQARIVDQIKILEEQEEITISFRGGGAEEVYV